MAVVDPVAAGPYSTAGSPPAVGPTAGGHNTSEDQPGGHSRIVCTRMTWVAAPSTAKRMRRSASEVRASNVASHNSRSSSRHSSNG
jgi:hypothetical protein